MTKYSIQKFCTIRNLRMQEGKWLIDVTDYENHEKMTKTITIGKRLNWQKLSEKIPNAVFNKKIKDSLTKELIGITFAKLSVEVIDNKGYSIPFHDKDGNLLISIDTGNNIVDDLTEILKRAHGNKQKKK